MDVAARAIALEFERYHEEFKAITRRARARFDRRDWHGAQSDSVERLDLYPRCIGRTLVALDAILGAADDPDGLWSSIKSRFSVLVTGRDDLELAETFFNSVVLKRFGAVGIDPAIVYVASDFQAPPPRSGSALVTSWPSRGSTEELITALLRSCPLETPFEDRERDARRAARAIDAKLRALGGEPCLDSIDHFHLNRHGLRC